MEVMSDVKDITSLMSDPSKEDEKLIADAFAFSKKAHEGHERYSGEPYFNHIFETAKTLAEIGMGPRTIAAGLLHDTIEDVDVKPEEIEERFGKEILFLVQGVTKLGHLKYRGAQRHTESLRKLFVATSQDIRVLLIKLADRLHNMQTLEHVPEEKRQRIALETLEIYAPLAYRLGVRKLHRELEDIAFKHAYPNEYEQTRTLLDQREDEIRKRLENMLKSIKKALAKEELTDVQTDCRVKGIYSLYKKMPRKNSDLTQICDVAAVRIVVPTVSDC
jgi:GTP pyrophosphokinase